MSCVNARSFLDTNVLVYSSAVAWLVLAAFSGPARLTAQVPEPGGGETVETAAVLSAARSAQAAFERARIARLPWAANPPPRPCDEIVGRFCFWHEESGWKPKPEHPEIGRARAELLERLDEAAAAFPGDDWIAGQRVRYLVEAGRHAQAAAAARACRAEAWWCRALEGYALHAGGDFAAAEAAFDRALSAMPERERARWSDLELVLDRDLARAWRRLGPGARAAFARRLWWLADPVWSVPGNERRSEHLARQVTARMMERARSPHDVVWGADLRELTIRYGWPIGWERARPRSSALGSGLRPSVIGHDPPAGRRWLPSRLVFTAPEASRPGDWPLAPARPRGAYAPAYADSVDELPHQLAVFRRGDRALVVAGYDLEAAGGAAGAASAPSEAALVVATGPDAPPRIASGGAPGGALLLEAPWEPAVASVEARAGRRAARARYGLPLPREHAVSDLLLLARPAPLPATLAEAAPLARGSTAVRARERVGVYFEIYPPSPTPAAARVSIALRDERGGFWRGLGAALGMDRAPTAGVALAWNEEIAPGAEVHPRALVVELPDLPEGDYALELEVSFPAGATHRAERPLVVRRSGAR